MKLKMMMSATIVVTSLAATLLTVGCMSDAPEMKTPDTGETTGTTAQQVLLGRLTVFDDSQYQGYSQSLDVGSYDWGQIHNDTISSLTVPKGMAAMLYSDTHFTGQSILITENTPWIGDEWNDRVSSIIVTQQTPPTPQNTTWNCFTSDGRDHGRINATGPSDLWYSDSPSDAATWCNQLFSDCANNGGCRASGDGIAPTVCDLSTRIDGCSVPSNDSESQWLAGVFHDACNAHDACYHAPWDAIGGDGFDTCNENFSADMYNACFGVSLLAQPECFAGASVWTDTMLFYPGRGDFWNSFQNDQTWVRNNCKQ